MTLWLVRHAQPLIGEGVCYGATDVPADAASTLEAARHLASVLPSRLPVVCSPLRRCTELARALQSLRPDLTWTLDPRLAEMNFGRWEGWRWSDISRKEIERWTDAFPDYRFGGEESVGELMARVALAYDDALRCGPGAWITHAGVIKAAGLLASGVSRVDKACQWPRETHPFGHCKNLELSPRKPGTGLRPALS